MNLHEFQAKQLFASYGIPVPRGGAAESEEQARAIASASTPMTLGLFLSVIPFQAPIQHRHSPCRT